MEHAVRERNKTVAGIYQRIGDIDLPSVKLFTLAFMFKDRSVAHDNAGGIVKLRNICGSVVVDLNNGKRGIRHPALLTHRKRIGNGFNRVRQQHSRKNHLTENRARQC